MRRLFLVALACMVGKAGPTWATESIGSGNGFYALCSGAKDDTRYVCWAYTRGLHDMAAYWIQERRVPNACPPAGATMVQYHDIFLRYLAERPATRHKPSAELFYAAIRDAFPCR